MKVLKSELDSSVNFVLDNGLECRFVQRSADYFIIYVSSHNGCNKACRFCHLTQTGQTDYDSTFFNEYIEQVTIVLEHWKNNIEFYSTKPVKVHVNFMARGEPLDNPIIRNRWGDLSTEIYDLIRQYVPGAAVKFKISTILPESIESTDSLLDNLKKGIKPEIYYSMYSGDEDFRRRWIPKAMSLSKSLCFVNKLMHAGIPVTFHYSLIKKENSRIIDEKAFIAKLNEYDVKGAKFNLVRYNPYSKAQGEEANDRQIMNYLSVVNDSGLFKSVKTIPKVGFDVKASCGMFINIKAEEKVK